MAANAESHQPIISLFGTNPWPMPAHGEPYWDKPMPRRIPANGESSWDKLMPAHGESYWDKPMPMPMLMPW